MLLFSKRKYNNSAGMLIKDRDKGISRITYNNIGLVDSILFDNGARIAYVYSMTGEKLKVTHVTPQSSISGPMPNDRQEMQQLSAHSVNTTREYLGGDIEIEGSSMISSKSYKYHFGNGYMAFTPGTSPVPTFYYYTKDHLGNVRSVVRSGNNGPVEVQRAAYYPFGGVIPEFTMNLSAQDHLYNGKELDTSNNLWWYDYVTRPYDPTRGQFINYDLHCESYYNMNPLTYCHNRPNLQIDPDGMDDYYSDGGSYLFSDVKETDYIYVISGYKYFTNNEGVKMAAVTDKKALADADKLSASALSDIYTNILQRAGYDTSLLHNGKVSIIKYIAENNSGLKDEVANDPVDKGIHTNTWAITTDDGNSKFKITMVYDNNDARKMLTTRSNILNCLGSHEFDWHGLGVDYKGHKVNNRDDSSALYENLKKTKSWRNTTKDYKKHVEEMINYYKLLGQ